MQFLRVCLAGLETPTINDKDGNTRDLTSLISDLSGLHLQPSALATLSHIKVDQLPKVPTGTRSGPCVGNVGKFICIGLNCADHAAESAMPVPDEPIIVMKATSAISGPNDGILIPVGSQKNWEVELRVAIGSSVRNEPEVEPLSHIAGYCVVKDISERAWQLERRGQRPKGKSADPFGPIGPWHVTPDEVPDPQNLNLWLDVAGQRFQSGSTRTMVFGVEFLISYTSRLMTLHRGDVISTGTAPGAGMGQNHPTVLKPEQTVRLGIEDLGVQAQRAGNVRCDRRLFDYSGQHACWKACGAELLGSVPCKVQMYMPIAGGPEHPTLAA